MMIATQLKTLKQPMPELKHEGLAVWVNDLELSNDIAGVKWENPAYLWRCESCGQYGCGGGCVYVSRLANQLLVTHPHSDYEPTIHSLFAISSGVVIEMKLWSELRAQCLSIPDLSAFPCATASTVAECWKIDASKLLGVQQDDVREAVCNVLLACEDFERATGLQIIGQLLDELSRWRKEPFNGELVPLAETEFKRMTCYIEKTDAWVPLALRGDELRPVFNNSHVLIDYK